jgi:DNA polymerase III sliding clamp (beta) subunit (PCNA family)
VKLSKEYKPEKCVFKQSGRNISHMYLDQDKERLVATDGHKMVVVQCIADPTGISGLISVDAIKHARTQAKGKNASVEIECGESLETKGAKHDRPEGGFPPYEQVIPKFEGPTFKVAINAKYLLEIAQALASTNNQVELEIPVDPKDPSRNDLSGIRIRAHETDAKGDLHSFGVLMPVRV